MTQQTVADLTVDELKKLIREVSLQTRSEMLSDPDKGLELRNELALELQRSLSDTDAPTTPASDMAAKLGLAW